MNIETRQAYSEVNKFLELIGEDLSNKIPLKLRNFFISQMDKTYIPKINANIPIKDQNLKRKTVAIISLLNLKYWCSENEKQKLLKIYSDNEKVYQKRIHEKYNPENMFKKNNKNQMQANHISLQITPKIPLYKRIFQKIIMLFNKK